MIWYMWITLDFMVTFCATQPFLGALGHWPWIFGTFRVLIAKLGHLERLVRQVRGAPDDGLNRTWSGHTVSNETVPKKRHETKMLTACQIH